MTIAEKNTLRYPEELSGTVTANCKALKEWAKSTARSTAAEYVGYQLPCERGVWDIRDETGSLLPSDASYACLLEPR